MAKGQCLCGALSFEVEGDPLWSAICHCESCRRATSSPFTAFVGFSRDSVRWTGDTPASYAHSEKAERLFCKKCGSQIAYMSNSRTDQIDLYTASFEDPNAFAPTKTAFREEALSFIQALPNLPDWN